MFGERSPADGLYAAMILESMRDEVVDRLIKVIVFM